MIKEMQVQSKILKEAITIKAVVPTMADIERILVLLHGKLAFDGVFSLLEQVPQELDLQTLALKYKAAIVMPYMRNRYYISTEDYNISAFISTELLDVVKETFSIGSDAEAMLGGISMGGYGAVLNAASSGRFDKILCISGAFIQDDVLIGNSEVWGTMKPTIESAKGSYLEFFLPLDSLEMSVRRNAVSALSLLENRKENVFVFMSCGTEDWLYSRNKKFADELKKQNINHVLVEIPGKEHDSMCFKDGLWEGMRKMCL